MDAAALYNPILDLKAIETFNLVKGFSTQPNLFDAAHAIPGIDGTANGYINKNNGVVSLGELGSGVGNGNSIKIITTAETYSGAAIQTPIAASSSVKYTMYALMKGVGQAKLMLYESPSYTITPGASALLKPYWQLFKVTITSKSDTNYLTPYWVGDGVASVINLGANLIRQDTV